MAVQSCGVHLSIFLLNLSATSGFDSGLLASSHIASWPSPLPIWDSTLVGPFPVSSLQYFDVLISSPILRCCDLYLKKKKILYSHFSGASGGSVNVLI